MKKPALFLFVVFAVAACLPLIYAYHVWNTGARALGEDEFNFGVTCGFNTTIEIKLLVDKVKNYTDLLVFDSWDVVRNETILNEVCDYASDAGLKFIVYFDLISGTADPSMSAYPWHKDWLMTADDRWSGKFLGIYLHDELGGKQLERQEYVTNASDYNDAANKFVAYVQSFPSLRWARNNGIPLFVSDFGLYWWVYLGGYDTVFVELGLLLHNTTQQIALCRGAANMQEKEWGAIIVWKTNDPPYFGSGDEMYSDMTAAYRAGAKYVLVFNDQRYPENNPYGTLNEEHFHAMEEFYSYTTEHPRNVAGKTEGRVALVLPRDYGWGLRHPEDKIWGLWNAPDDKSPIVWENMNKLTEMYGLELDIVFDDPRFKPREKYSVVYVWNATIT